jgi:hypothetical protein
MMSAFRCAALVGIIAVAGGATSEPLASPHPPRTSDAPVYDDLGTPPSGAVPILFNGRHVYVRPDHLAHGRLMAALVRGNTILQPLRSLFEQMGATVSYDPVTQTIDIAKPGTEVRIARGSAQLVVDGAHRLLDARLEPYDGALLIPVRTVCESLGAYVEWVPARRLAVIAMFTDPIPVSPSP